ncbi:hypothetical protein AIOL_000192 [Candidatus Rhodobacter oscarellae]|uniref:Uncharacterized protein n=1 Tax=Candidatus Rhodobacter oscarellae TaxID=1675527 RepID=A0A0J9EB95_9RHOB|nr:DUF2161 family putative PD-(D/E)XK-type phosphodiesterase [Candidatus Rhodobacter lobularis]KMW60042.1 hypothetical protein AIOL_000192 [Candidatus Rhodobacter lobularis]
MKESDLYGPVKTHLEAQGFAVKGEVGAADVVAMRDEEMAVVELKLAFSLTLLHQAVARLAVTDQVYVCVARPKKWKPLQANIKLCRRLGLGVMSLRASDGFLEVHAEPGPYAPRKSKTRKARLEKEFARRIGDPNDGGATRHGLVTAYRQDAIRCATYLAEYGASRGAAVKADTGVSRATTLMRDNHYGWFEKVEKGVYRLNEAGRAALADWGDALE